MTDQTLPARMAASLYAELSSRSGTTEAANETTNEADKDQKMKKVGAEIEFLDVGVRAYAFTFG